MSPSIIWLALYQGINPGQVTSLLHGTHIHTINSYTNLQSLINPNMHILDSGRKKKSVWKKLHTLISGHKWSNHLYNM